MPYRPLLDSRPFFIERDERCSNKPNRAGTLTMPYRPLLDSRPFFIETRSGQHAGRGPGDDAGRIGNRCGGIQCSTQPAVRLLQTVGAPAQAVHQPTREAIPGRSTAGRGDSRGDARGRGSPDRATDQGTDCCSVASRPADLGGSRLSRARSRAPTRLFTRSQRQRRQET
jgi:hypothetical protein